MIGIALRIVMRAGGPEAIALAAPRPFEDVILRAVADYRSFERVTDSVNWAPYLCSIPQLSGVDFSQSKDDDTHGRKLYFLFAKDGSAYLSLNSTPLEKPKPLYDDRGVPNNVLVKEAFEPELVPPGQWPEPDADWKRPPFGENHAKAGDDLFRAGAPAGLFVMLKLDPATPGTDQGWVYGTLTHDGRKVTSSGMIESCVECHRRAPYDRLHGLQWRLAREIHQLAPKAPVPPPGFGQPKQPR